MCDFLNLYMMFWVIGLINQTYFKRNVFVLVCDARLSLTLICVYRAYMSVFVLRVCTEYDFCLI